MTITSISYSLDGISWVNLPLIDTHPSDITFSVVPSQPILTGLESFSWQFTTGFRSVNYVKVALDCMHYWLGEMAKGEAGAN